MDRKRHATNRDDKLTLRVTDWQPRNGKRKNKANRELHGKMKQEVFMEH